MKKGMIEMSQEDRLTDEQQKLVDDYMKTNGEKFIHVLIYQNSNGRTSEDEKEELIGEAHLALMKAAKRFDNSKSSFSTYAACVIKSQLKSWYRDQNRLCRIINKMSISLDDTDENDMAYVDKIASKDSFDDISDSVQKYINTLNREGYAAVQLIMKGYTLKEIQNKWGYTAKQMSNLLDHLRKNERVRLLWRG